MMDKRQNSEQYRNIGQKNSITANSNSNNQAYYDIGAT